MSVWMCLSVGALGALVLCWVLGRMTGFVAQTPEDYEDGTPDFDVRAHLNGPMLCEGVIYGPLGRVSSRFVADFDCTWDGNTGVIDEHFVYDDGSTQDRKWHLQVTDTGALAATADDVVGQGAGRQTGPAVMLTYKIRLPDNAGGHVLKTLDWMYLTPNGTIMNRSQFRKFGIKVAELIATIRPKDPA
ncbi:DUF3833 domain-containing protein [Roseobacter sp.]|uniref:DUF3833 domain-containing protein n=1 Tax=Roseobacter sp. TaxID=1907202 RepID=UPI0032999512